MTNKTNNNENGANHTKKRQFILDGKVSEDSIRKVVEAIININLYDEEQKEKDSEYKAQPIKLIVNTFGGSVYDANMLVGIMESSETPIYTYCYGKAMSAGFLIFSAGHKRFASNWATFMYHDMSVGIHGTIEGMKNDFEWYVKLRDQIDEYLLEVTNLPKEMMDYKKEREKDWYMTSREAFNYGLVDEIISPRSKK